MLIEGKIRRAATEHFKKLLKFIVVGVANTAIDFSVYFFLTRYWPFFATNYLFAHFCAFLLATGNSFFFNRNWTFRSRHPRPLRQYCGFVLLQTFNLGLSSLLILLVIQAGGHDLSAKIAASLVILLVNFCLSRYLVFRV